MPFVGNLIASRFANGDGISFCMARAFEGRKNQLFPNDKGRDSANVVFSMLTDFSINSPGCLGGAT